MLIPADRATPDWTPHWEKTFRLIEEGVFQKEDIACAIGIQRGLKSGANDHLTAGRAEQGSAGSTTTSSASSPACRPGRASRRPARRSRRRRRLSRA